MALKMLTIEQVKSRIKLTATPADADLSLLAESLEDFIAENLGLSLSPREVESELLKGGGRYLRPAVNPVTEISEITVFTPADTVVTITEDDYLITEEGILRKGSGCRYWEYEEYLISYTAGYADAAACPARLKQAALKMVAQLYSNPDGKMSVGSKAGSTVWNELIDRDTRLLLESCSYRSMF